jgi:hypothetical protein
VKTRTADVSGHFRRTAACAIVFRRPEIRVEGGREFAGEFVCEIFRDAGKFLVSSRPSKAESRGNVTEARGVPPPPPVRWATPCRGEARQALRTPSEGARLRPPGAISCHVRGLRRPKGSFDSSLAFFSPSRRPFRVPARTGGSRSGTTRFRQVKVDADR